MGIVLTLLRAIADTFREALGGGDGAQADREARSEQRHMTLEQFLDKRGRLLSMVPLIIILAVSSTNIIAAVWSAFAISFFLMILDFYRARYNPSVVFPNIVQTSLLIGYTVCVILVYVLTPPLSSNYIGPIVVSIITAAMIASFVLMYPFTMQFSGPRVDEETRKSLQFYRFNQILTLFWIIIMGGATGCAWGSLQFPADSAGQIILGIVMLIVLPLLGQILTPFLVDYLKSKGKASASESKKNDEERTGLLEKA